MHINLINFLYLMCLYIMIIDGNNMTEWFRIRRHRRSLVYHYGAVIKFVGGITFPMPLADKVPYRQLVVAYNLQAQYGLPTTAKQWYPKWTGRELENMKFNGYKISHQDDSRNLIYALIELYIEKNKQNGRECLLKAICENGQIDVTEGILGEIFQAVLTPNSLTSPKDYLDAYEAGKSGVYCPSLFHQCNRSFLDEINVIK